MTSLRFLNFWHLGPCLLRTLELLLACRGQACLCLFLSGSFLLFLPVRATIYIKQHLDVCASSPSCFLRLFVRRLLIAQCLRVLHRTIIRRHSSYLPWCLLLGVGSFLGHCFAGLGRVTHPLTQFFGAPIRARPACPSPCPCGGGETWR